MANLYTTKTDGIDIVYAADVNELQAGVGFATEPGGRLTLETGVPISTTDQSAKATLYYTAYTSNRIPLYSGSAWQLVNFASDLSISLVGTTASLPYDVFCYNNSGTATLELTAWTNTTTRATALTRQDGRYVKTGATTRLYLGTILIDAAGGAASDTKTRRGVWNMYNRVGRSVITYNVTSSWTYATNTYQEYNAGTGQTRGEFVLGLADKILSSDMGYRVQNSGTNAQNIGLNIDSTTTENLITLQIYGSTFTNISQRLLWANYYTPLAAGSHYMTQIERCVGGTMTNYGSAIFFYGVITMEM